MEIYDLGDDERLDYGVDWTPETLTHSRTIASSVWTVPDELTKIADATNDDRTSITVEPSGSAVIGETYEVKNVVTFDDIDATRREVSIFFMIVERKVGTN